MSEKLLHDPELEIWLHQPNEMNWWFSPMLWMVLYLNRKAQILGERAQQSTHTAKTRRVRCDVVENFEFRILLWSTIKLSALSKLMREDPIQLSCYNWSRRRRTHSFIIIIIIFIVVHRSNSFRLKHKLNNTQWWSVFCCV